MMDDDGGSDDDSEVWLFDDYDPNCDDDMRALVVWWLGARALTKGWAVTQQGWVARVEYPVPKHYTCQAVRSGFRESFSWLSIVVRMRRKIEAPPT